MAAKKTENQTVINIKPIKLQKARITLVGDTPLIVHAWSEKAKRMMLEAQQKKKVDKKAMAVRDPFSEFMDAAYWITPEPEEKTPDQSGGSDHTADTSDGADPAAALLLMLTSLTGLLFLLARRRLDL